MAVAMLVLALAAPPTQADREVTAAEKAAFLSLVATLPTEGEFLTEEAVRKAATRTRVLLALTEDDIKGDGLYRVGALSRGLYELGESRAYVTQRFGRIAHPRIKLGWAVMLFNGGGGLPGGRRVPSGRPGIEGAGQAPGGDVRPGLRGLQASGEAAAGSRPE